MSAPYIIWTMQRTGGTTLAALLSELTEHPKIEHEPFNVERALGWVTRNWREKQDADLLQADLRRALEERPVIKHCYELVPEELNSALMVCATELGYKHVILDRRAEQDRILSLELAKQTGAWGGKGVRGTYDRVEAGDVKLHDIDTKAALGHMGYCQKRRQFLATQFAKGGQSPFVVYFEDVYSDPDAGRKRVGDLIAFLGIVPSEHPNYAAQVDEALLKKGQNSARVMDLVPNIEDVRAKLIASLQEKQFEFSTR
ncbi:hypothetical protein [Shimia marina]|uniref:Stf0 sulfotransferase n=1 Tax=Shimia marina TaxID=321267 RepID=A0A0N7LRQ9_9RHOB|nr:hypothetical protein [Shimia marina]CUH51508.1 hypothetical protein SHM7688_00945 [Shimia marina]SFD47385.1 hypothetical protein SAMN04488037_101161 [Shimia marina]